MLKNILKEGYVDKNDLHYNFFVVVPKEVWAEKPEDTGKELLQLFQSLGMQNCKCVTKYKYAEYYMCPRTLLSITALINIPLKYKDFLENEGVLEAVQQTSPKPSM